MIRVNLLRQIGAPAASPAGASFGADGPSLPVDELNKKAAQKFIAILAGPILVYALQRAQIASQESEISALEASAAQVVEEITALGPVGPKAERFQADQKKLQAQLNAMKSLSRVRLREVKALDAIQNLMPSHTWLTNIRIEGGVVNLQGYSNSETGYGELQRAIEASVFHEVEPKSTAQESSAAGPLQRFEIEFKVGRQEPSERQDL